MLFTLKVVPTTVAAYPAGPAVIDQVPVLPFSKADKSMVPFPVHTAGIVPPIVVSGQTTEGQEKVFGKPNQPPEAPIT